MDSEFSNNNNTAIIYNNKHRIVISGGTSYILINDKIYHLYNHVIYTNKDYLVPATAFVNHTGKLRIFDNLTLDSMDKNILITNPTYNITDYNILTKGNGYSIEITTTQTFDKELIEYTRSGNNWLSITIPGGLVDSLNMYSTNKVKPVVDFKTRQMDQVVQISFLLNIIPKNIVLNSNNKKINIDIFVPKDKKATKPKEEKHTIDTIVLDAGHGGKDPGACVKHCKIQEKNITLTITKKIGDILTKKHNMNVIYTRTDDRFITLRNRTKIANDNNAKLFISIHVNSIDNSPKTKGFETYFLTFDKSEDAKNEVEKRENSVVPDYETNIENPEVINKINAEILHYKYLEGSKELAGLIQEELENMFNKKLNRGVRQAGFQVLWGATMPNVLVEVGFITNAGEMNNLLSSQYQTKIAEGIANAIIQYKKQHNDDTF